VLTLSFSFSDQDIFSLSFSLVDDNVLSFSCSFSQSYHPMYCFLLVDLYLFSTPFMIQFRNYLNAC